MPAHSAIVVIAFVLAQVVASTNISSNEGSGVISKDAYILCGLSIGDSETKAQEVLGKPKSLHLESSPHLGEREVGMAWSGIEGAFLDSELVNLKVRSSECGNLDGIVVGASVDRVFALLGRTKAEVRNDGTERYRYWLEGTDCYFLVVTHGDKIVELELWFDYA